MICQFLWVTGSEDAFEQAVPVLWHGEHLRSNGWENSINLCFLQGLEHLSSEYRARLTELGYTIMDCAPLAAAMVERYPASRRLSTTSRYWFLRWNVLQRLAVEREAETVVHLDGDVVLLCDPRELYQDVAGKTFMLQGCPALSVITDPEWFSVWEEELSLLLENRPSYVAKALAEKASPHCPDREFCNVCAYDGDRFEDQDMLEYLIASGRLPQARSAEVFTSRYYWMQNPLMPGDWHEEQAPGAPRQVAELNGSAFVGNKQVAFYHFQNDFAKYCRAWSALSRVGLNGLAVWLKPGGTARRGSRLAATAGSLLDLLNRRVSRREICEAAFRANPDTGNRYITDIVNSCWE